MYILYMQYVDEGCIALGSMIQLEVKMAVVYEEMLVRPFMRRPPRGCDTLSRRRSLIGKPDIET